MGISGHMLGPRKLRRLSAATGLPLARAYRRGDYAEGVVRSDSGCQHYAIDPRTFQVEVLNDPTHWTSCRAWLTSIMVEEAGRDRA